MELQRGIKRFAIGLFLLLFAVGVVPLPVLAAEEQGNADKIQITYYYFSSCESCEDGENYLLTLEGQIEDAISPEEYEFHLKNVFEEDAYEDFMERTQDMATDEFTPAPPMLDVNGTCLFGVDDITNKARSVILEEKENCARKKSGWRASAMFRPRTLTLCISMCPPVTTVKRCRFT